MAFSRDSVIRSFNPIVPRSDSVETFRQRNNYDYWNEKPFMRKRVLSAVNSTDKKQTINSRFSFVKPNKEVVFGQTNLNSAKRVLPPATHTSDYKVLKFDGYVNQCIDGTIDNVTARPLTITYFLNKDTILVKDKYDNGKSRLFNEQKIPKHVETEYYHWKDFRLGERVKFHGLDITLVKCDSSTTKFYESKGIDIGEAEIASDGLPNTSHNYNPISKAKQPKTSLNESDQFLSFYCLWNTNNGNHVEVQPCVLMFYLSDSTLEVIARPTVGRDDKVITKHVIERQKIFKDQILLESPTCVQEVKNGTEYYHPSDLRIGKTLRICGYSFLLYDCDQLTKEYYSQHYGVADFTPVDVTLKYPYCTWGPIEVAFEESSVRRGKVKKNIKWEREHADITFNYSAKLQSNQALDRLRRFVIRVHIANEMISVYEQAVPGFVSGMFLSKRHVPKRVGDWRSDNSPYYTYMDFCVGKTVELFRHKFLITAEDSFVARYKKDHPESFPENNDKTK